jgi:hypothetical protein
MPCTPWRRTSSAIRNASTIDTRLSSTVRSREFGIVIKVSTSRERSSTPRSAASARRVPSNENGLVTTPTVRAPSSRAIRATTGAAPVPVPPPDPQVMNTMSAPLMSAFRASCSSRADWRPRSGLAPAPRPRVSCGPMWSVSCACDDWSDCTSVLTAMKSTPSTPASIIRLTALTPAPPTPTTFRTGSWIWSGATGTVGSSRP